MKMQIVKNILLLTKKIVKLLFSLLIGMWFFYFLAITLYRIPTRLIKSDEFYKCSMTYLNKDGKHYGDRFVSSIRVSWPFELSELWVSQTGNALIDGDRFDLVFEGPGKRDHKVAGRQSDGTKVFNLDRVSGNVSVLDDRTWIEGVCTRKVRDF